MAMMGFTKVDGREPHALRRREMIQAHPEVRSLFGTNPWTLAITIVLVIAQLTMAFAVANQPWWVIVLAAWCLAAMKMPEPGVPWTLRSNPEPERQE